MVKMLVSGCINWDINLFIKRFPSVGEEVSVTTLTRVPGGTAANVSVAAARLLKPGDVAFIGCLGNDTIADAQIDILEKEGIDTSGIKRVEDESGQAYITINEKGQNCIYTYFGANRYLLPGDLVEATRHDLIKSSKVIVIMDPPLPTAAKMAELGKSNNALIIWDPGVYADLGINKLANVLALTDYFILNHIEFNHLLETNMPNEIGAKLANIRKDLKAIVKQGAKGSTLVKDRGQTVTFFPSIKLETGGLRVVNTVGCGDAFIGAFAALKVQGASDEEAVQQANFSGAFKATREETRGSPTRTELMAFVKKFQ